MGVYCLHVCYAQQKVYLTVYAKNFIGSSDICLMALYILHKLVKFPIRHLDLAIGNVRCV